MFQKYQKNIRNNCTLNWVLGNDELFYEQNVVFFCSNCSLFLVFPSAQVHIWKFSIYQTVYEVIFINALLVWRGNVFLPQDEYNIKTHIILYRVSGVKNWRLLVYIVKLVNKFDMVK